jgi:magnesium chelatase subunit I
MKLAILVAAVDPGIGGVLVFGDRGTGKSTAVRALAALLPKMEAVVGCRYGCDPRPPRCRCACARCAREAAKTQRLVPVPVVDLPLGATEDRVVGALDLERALTAGRQGLRARPAGPRQPRLPVHRRGQPARRPPGRPADRRRRLGRERGRARRPERAPPRALRAGGQRQPRGRRAAAAAARPLRPVGRGEARPPTWPTRIEVVRRRDAFERDPAAFTAHWKKDDAKLRKRIVAARKRCCPRGDRARRVLERAAKLCMALGTDGLRGELTLMRAARALAAFEGDQAVDDAHLQARGRAGAAPPAAAQPAGRRRLHACASSALADLPPHDRAPRHPRMPPDGR